MRRIANDGAGQHEPRTSAHSLEKAREDKRIGVRSEQAGHAGKREYAEPDEQGGPAAKAIRRRAVEQLSDSQSQDVETCDRCAQPRST
jgi:hypothetical protein